MNPAILRAIAYVLTLGMGALAAWLAAAGFGIYDDATGLYTVTVDVKAAVAYIVAMIGGGGLSLTALLRGWRGLGG